jgi:hypothetical protein
MAHIYKAHPRSMSHLSTKSFGDKATKYSVQVMSDFAEIITPRCDHVRRAVQSMLIGLKNTKNFTQASSLN